MKKRLAGYIFLWLSASILLFSNGQKDGTAAKGDAPVKIVWWDHYMPLAPLHEAIWDKYRGEDGKSVVEYTQYDPSKLSEAIQLAYRSGQSPDVFPNVMGVPDSKLYHEGWFQPLSLSEEELPPVLRNNLFEGFTKFDGKIYSFPLFSILNHPASTWFNADLVKQAGFDGKDIPTDYDRILRIARAVKDSTGGKAAGIILPLKFFGRMNTTIDDMAMAAGGTGPIDWKTGEYTYDSEYYFQVFDFLTSFKKDGTIHPGSIGFDMRQARERWAAGEAALLLDGSWNIGVIEQNFPEVSSTTGVSPVPGLSKNRIIGITRGPAMGTFWISSQSRQAALASQILKEFTSRSYYIKLAERMDQPPLDLDAVAEADVHGTYKKVVSFFGKEMRFSPDPTLRNVDISLVYAEMKDIHPNPAEILQGYYGEAVQDYKAELRKYNRAMTEERNRAIGKVAGEGMDISLDDWVFSNWIQGEDFNSSMY